MSNSLQWSGCRRLRLACRHPRPSNRFSLRLHRLNRRKRNAGKDEMEVAGGRREMRMKNQKLYVENQIIIEENEMLRKIVVFLHQENHLLSSKLLLQVSQKQQQQQPLTTHLFSEGPSSNAYSN